MKDPASQAPISGPSKGFSVRGVGGWGTTRGKEGASVFSLLDNINRAEARDINTITNTLAEGPRSLPCTVD